MSEPVFCSPGGHTAEEELTATEHFTPPTPSSTTTTAPPVAPPTPCRCGFEKSSPHHGSQIISAVLLCVPANFCIMIIINAAPLVGVHHVLAVANGPVLCGDTGGL